MTKKNVLIIGATGLVGSHLVQALQERGHRVHALVRSETLASQEPLKQARVSALVRRGVELHEGALDDHDALTKACKATDVVVSALAAAALSEQSKILDAIQAAGGVERFIPSEYGGDPQLGEPGRVLMFDMKRQFQAAVQAAGVPYTFFYSNGLASHWATALGDMGEAPPTAKVNVWGGGNVQATIVTLEDNARLLAATVDDPRTLNKAVAIVDPRLQVTQNELIEHWEERTGHKLERSATSAEDIDGVITDCAGREDKMLDMIIMQLVRAVWIDGATTTLGDGVLNTLELYPEVHLTSPRAYVDRFHRAKGDALAAPVRAYIEAVNSMKPADVVKPFAKGYRSDQPTHPARSFTGPSVVQANYERLFTGAKRVVMSVRDFTVRAADADGVADHWVEVDVDIHRDNGTVDYMSGTMILSATSDEIRAGRVYMEPVEAP